MTQLTLYMKPTCHLCHDALALLEALQVEFSYTIHQVDILQDAPAYEKHWQYIPVVEVADRIILTAPMNEASTRKALLLLRQEGLLG